MGNLHLLKGTSYSLLFLIKFNLHTNFYVCVLVNHYLGLCQFSFEVVLRYIYQHLSDMIIHCVCFACIFAMTQNKQHPEPQKCVLMLPVHLSLFSFQVPKPKTLNLDGSSSCMLMEPVFTPCTDASNNGEDPAAEWGTRLLLRGGEWHRAAAAAPSPPRPGGRQAEVGCHICVFSTHSSFVDDDINTDC